MAATRLMRIGAATVLSLAVAAGLTACIPSSTPNGGATQSGKPTQSKTPTPTPTKPPVLLPSGTAAENLPYFDYVNINSFNAFGFVEGIAYIQNLAAAGFDQTQMELTWFDTPDGHQADSVFFSVRFNGECLVGQIAAWGYEGTVLPILGTGSCMVGAYLQPIN